MSFYRHFPILLFSLFKIDTGYTQNLTPAVLLNERVIEDDNNHTWTSLNYPQPYPSENRTMILRVQAGYSIVIFVTELDLDSANGDFLLIKGGEILEDENKGVVLTYNLKSERKYVIEHSSAYLAFEVLGKNSAHKKGFSLIYKRTGEEITSTETPMTTILWPTPSEGDSIYLTVNVSGKTQEEFANKTTLNNFKIALANMAMEYCFIRSISLSQNITFKNVHISYLIRCSYNWPESEMCVRMQLSIPAFLSDNSTLNGYQLSSENLEHMWTLLADKWLSTVSMSVYKEPDSDSKLILWVVISCIILTVVTLGLLIVKNVSKPKRRCSDTNAIIEKEVKPKKFSLTPHPLQVIPPFFDNFDNNHNESIYQHEPKIDVPYNEADFFSDDSDDEIIISWNHILENNNSESNT